MSADAGGVPVASYSCSGPVPDQHSVVPVILLGTGQVARALMARLLDLDPDGRFRLIAAANSRVCTADANGLDRRRLLRRASDDDWSDAGWTPLSSGDPLARLAVPARAIVVDATASDAVAARHPRWLDQGRGIVTANKLGLGGPLSRWRQIQSARSRCGSGYGDSATVGAGLPLLSTLRALVAGGDRIHGIEGVLSGSLAWLFDRYDGSQPFSQCVREAVAAGYTEPDPRIDLGGEDVRRKLLILARSAGQALSAEQVSVDSLVPSALAAVASDRLDAALTCLDEPLRERLHHAQAKQTRLACVACLDAEEASVSVRALPDRHPLAMAHSTDNRVLIRSDRYRQQPLLIQGPGAGAELTAAALLDDLRRLA